MVRSTVIIAVAIMLTAVADGREPVLHRVGGKVGWTDDMANYTQWSLDETPPFYVGDWLLFAYDKHRYNVLEVNKTSYEECNERGFMKNITKGGKDVFNLTQAKTYYFLSGGGYCYQGMKLSVDVVDYSGLASAPTPDNSSSPGNIDTVITYIVLLLLLVIITPSTMLFSNCVLVAFMI